MAIKQRLYNTVLRVAISMSFDVTRYLKFLKPHHGLVKKDRNPLVILNSLKGRISIDSPLGKALLHHTVNDKVTVQGNAGGREFNFDVIVRNIEKLEDDGEDEMRKY
jgi:hypothetical protein